MDRLFVDTGAWFAFFNRADEKHESVAEVLLRWQGRLATTDYIFDELTTLLRFRVDHATASRAGNALRSGQIVEMSTVEDRDLDAAWNTFRSQSDQPYSFTDCTSFAVMRRLKLQQAAALDDDFRHAGFLVLPMDAE